MQCSMIKLKTYPHYPLWILQKKYIAALNFPQLTVSAIAISLIHEIVYEKVPRTMFSKEMA